MKIWADYISSILIHYIWWGLGVMGGAVLIVLLLKNYKRLKQNTRVRTDLAWRHVRMRAGITGEFIRQQVRMAVGVIQPWIRNRLVATTAIAVVSFVVLAFLLEQVTDGAVEQLESILSHYLLLGLGIGAAIVGVVLISRNKGGLEYAGKIAGSKWFLWPVAIVLLVLIIGNKVLEYGTKRVPKASAYQLTPVAVGRLPAEVALPIIAECESGGRQFDDEGNLIRNLESSAIGKYQIMASLHEEKARGMGFDIRTEAGNEAYAKFLYQGSGTLHWEADSRSRACWEPKLMARAGLSSARTYTFAANVGREWTDLIPVHTTQRADWMPESAVTYQLMTADGKIFTFPAAPQAPIEVSSYLSPGFRFRTVDADSAVINVITRPR